MALKLCSFNCRGFNVAKIKHIESILNDCDILLLQETWLLANQVGKLNQYFSKYNTYGISGIKDTKLLSGRPYGGLSFLYRKTLSPYIEYVEIINSKRICCIRLMTNIGAVYLFNIYMPGDTKDNLFLYEYNHELSVLSSFFRHSNVLNCIVGGDLNADLSRIQSGNTLSLQQFVADENMKLVLMSVQNLISHTYKGIRDCTSLIDHFIVSENIEGIIMSYYTCDSIDNLSDHIPLHVTMTCTMSSICDDPCSSPMSIPLWDRATTNDITLYQKALDEQLLHFFPANSMFCSPKNLILKKEFIHVFHDRIIMSLISAMENNIPYSGKPRCKVIPGWDIELDYARETSLFWSHLWKECGGQKSGMVYEIMKSTRKVYHYKLRGLQRKKNAISNNQYQNLCSCLRIDTIGRRFAQYVRIHTIPHQQ